MRPLRYLLLADGPSDDCLLPVIEYALRLSPALIGRDLIPDFARPGHADVGRTSDGLDARVRNVLASRSCDLLFVHRDAEKVPLAERQGEIAAAVPSTAPPYVPVVPVRMTESWLLFDLSVIRRVADKPNGRTPLQLPPLRSLERLAKPKDKLWELLVAASEKSGRQLASFMENGEMYRRRRRVAESIRDFSPLMPLPAFRAFVEKTQAG